MGRLGDGETLQGDAQRAGHGQSWGLLGQGLSEEERAVWRSWGDLCSG